MVSVKERHEAFIDEIQSGIKEFEANVAPRCDMPEDLDHDELMAELERKFDELFGTGSD